MHGSQNSGRARCSRRSKPHQVPWEAGMGLACAGFRSVHLGTIFPRCPPVVGTPGKNSLESQGPETSTVHASPIPEQLHACSTGAHRIHIACGFYIIIHTVSCATRDASRSSSSISHELIYTASVGAAPRLLSSRRLNVSSTVCTQKSLPVWRCVRYSAMYNCGPPCTPS